MSSEVLLDLLSPTLDFEDQIKLKARLNPKASGRSMREILTCAEKCSERSLILRALLDLLEFGSSCAGQSICIQPGFIHRYDQERDQSRQESPPRDISLNEVLVYGKRSCYDAASN